MADKCKGRDTEETEREGRIECKRRERKKKVKEYYIQF